jgi:pyroglutamyl-peptidase
VVSFGVSAKAEAVTLERYYLNHAEGADVLGAGALPRPIQPRGPLARRNTLPLERVHRVLHEAGIPVVWSNHAGAYLCNFLGYLAAAHSARAGNGCVSGFVHIPPFQTLSEAAQLRAARLIAQTVAAATG